jgi:hypothetical protein
MTISAAYGHRRGLALLASLSLALLAAPAALLTGVAAAGAADFVNAQAFYTVRDIRTASAALPEGASEALLIDTGTMSAGAWTRRP